MFGILWLTLWATVGEAFYDDYWFDQGDAGVAGLAWGSKKHLKHNFTESLKSFNRLYHAARERSPNDESMSVAKAKLHLKALKVYRHNEEHFELIDGKLLPLPDGAKYCTMGRHTKVDCNQCTCVAGQMYMCTGMICPTPNGRPTFLATCREGKHRKIDACNYCFCRNGHEICTNKDCNNLQFSLRSRCPEGERRQIGCNRCLCLRGEEYCTNHNCNQNSFSESFLHYWDVNKCTNGDLMQVKCQECVCINRSWSCSTANCAIPNGIHKHITEPNCEDGEILIDFCNVCYCRKGKIYCESNDCDYLKGQKFRISRDGDCIEGSKFKKDECNHCYCYRGREICTNMDCGDASFKRLQRTRVCEQGDTKQESCNSCYCFIGNWICTRIPCPSEEKHPIHESYDDGPDIDFLKGRGCSNGDRKVHDCNFCTCRESRWICTRIGCGRKNERSERYLRNEYQTGCKENEQKKLDCNLCLCIDRHWLCTQRKCHELHNGYNHDVSNVHPKELADSAFYLQPCTTGEERRKDMCNRCYCANKKWFCQIKPCGKSVDIFHLGNLVDSKVPRPKSSYVAKCRKGSKRKKDACNTCYCRHKTWFCENKACGVPTGHPEIGKIPSDNRAVNNECEIGEVQQTQCQYCVCMANGYRCKITRDCRTSLKTGLPYLRDSKCKIGSKYLLDECNYCYCSDNGEYICTNNFCLDSGSVSLKTSACEIGMTEKIDSCNYCYCSSDQIWDCTTNYCPEKQSHPHLRARKCLLGTRYRLDACNYCYCDYDRNLICTNHSCPQYLRASRKCDVGERQEIDACNHCVCNFDGLWHCSKNDCPEQMARTIYLGNPEKIFNNPSGGFRTPYTPCVNGARRQIDACNYCLCLKGQEFCTDKNCRSAPTGKYFMAPCSPGQSVPQRDPCNECICIDSEVVCTKVPCFRKMQEPGDTRSGKCVEGNKKMLKDGCNYCVCSSGQEFCTSRACMIIQADSSSCEEGGIIPAKDKCNMCVCVQGKVSCTNKVCPKIKRQGNGKKKPGFRFKKFSDPVPAQSLASAKVCEEGLFYNPDDYDPKCPNICVCDRGELLCTHRRCRWREKALPPEWGTKSLKYKHRPSLKQMGCVDYQIVPSDDPCYECHCLHNRIICHFKNCKQNKHETKSRHKEKKPIEPFPDLFCTPFTFYSPDNNRFCRNCFCLHNGLSLCLLNFCKYSKDVPHDPPESIYDMCTPGEVGHPTKCVTCKCSDNGKWVCTREQLSECDERNCDARDEFQMGFQTFCAACKCGSKEWYCAIEEGPCSDYADVKCPMGILIHNPQQFCSICICGGYEGASNMCFTEAKCVQQVLAHIH